MRLIRSLLFVIWMYGWMAILGILCLPTLLMPRIVVLFCIRNYVRLMLFGLYVFCGVRVELRGKEHVTGGPQLIAGKHQAMLDVFMPFLFFRDPVLVMKRELLWYPVLGWYALKTGQLPIDRSGGAQTMRKMLEVARRVIAERGGRQLIIYPEGTRVAPGAEPDYKPAGIRAFYKSLELPIFPLATNAGLSWPARGLVRTPGTVVYELHPPIPEGLPPKEMVKRLEAELEAASTALLPEGHIPAAAE